jgi:DnaJ-class molecular chaperone
MEHPINKSDRCENNCINGFIAINSGLYDKCTACSGTGKYIDFYSLFSYSKCPSCKGRGKIYIFSKIPCYICYYKPLVKNANNFIKTDLVNKINCQE